MELYDDVIIKASGKRGMIVDDGISEGLHYFTVELDDAANLPDGEDIFRCGKTICSLSKNRSNRIVFAIASIFFTSAVTPPAAPSDRLRSCPLRRF